MGTTEAIGGRDARWAEVAAVDQAYLKKMLMEPEGYAAYLNQMEKVHDDVRVLNEVTARRTRHVCR